LIFFIAPWSLWSSRQRRSEPPVSFFSSISVGTTVSA
jgi:hypothetical protein